MTSFFLCGAAGNRSRLKFRLELGKHRISARETTPNDVSRPGSTAKGVDGVNAVVAEQYRCLDAFGAAREATREYDSPAATAAFIAFDPYHGSMTLKGLHEPVAPSRAGQALGELDALLAEHGPADVPVAVSGAPDVVHLPHDIAMILREVLVSFATGTPVAVLPTHAELTTQQAADLLNVSRPYVIKLLDAGELAHRKVGTHRRIRIDDLQAYQRAQALAGKRAADELTELSQNLGLY